ncbi:MAG: hypothetical protein VX834_13160, partial [Myxococcota bacterium]|nr:hypothetical protein [Myxococcota bacterium]
MTLLRGMSLIAIVAMMTASVGCGQSGRTIDGAEGDATPGTVANETTDAAGSDSTAGSVDDSGSADDDETGETSADSTDASTEDTGDAASDSVDVGDEPSDDVGQQAVRDTMDLGDYAVLTGEESFTTADGTSVSLATYWPDATGTFPTVFFGHGFMLSTDLYV